VADQRRSPPTSYKLPVQAFRSVCSKNGNLFRKSRKVFEPSEFANVKLALSKTSLPTLFGGDYDEDDPRHKISCLPAKWAGLTIPDATSSAEPNCDSSVLLCSHVWPPSKLLTLFYQRTIWQSSPGSNLSSNFATKQSMRPRGRMISSLTSKFFCNNRRTVLRGQETGQWLLAMPSTVNGTKVQRPTQA
jgi:hypothetical protein